MYSSIKSEHYLCELRQIFESEGLLTWDYVLKNPTRFEWVLPTMEKDIGVEYLEVNRFEKYKSQLYGLDLDANFKESFDNVSIFNLTKYFTKFFSTATMYFQLLLYLSI